MIYFTLKLETAKDYRLQDLQIDRIDNISCQFTQAFKTITRGIKYIS